MLVRLLIIYIPLQFVLPSQATPELCSESISPVQNPVRVQEPWSAATCSQADHQTAPSNARIIVITRIKKHIYSHIIDVDILNTSLAHDLGQNLIGYKNNVIKFVRATAVVVSCQYA